MKKTMIASLACLFSGASMASGYLGTDFISIDSEIGLDSDYLYQGVSASDDDPSVYAKFRAHFYEIDNLSVGVEVRSLDFLDVDYGVATDLTFTDSLFGDDVWGYELYGKYTFLDSSVADDFGTLGGALTAMYPVQLSKLGFDTEHVVPVEAKVGVDHSFDFLASNVGNTYLFLDYDLNVYEDLWVDLHAGKTNVDLADNFGDYSIGLSYRKEHWGVGAGFADTSISGDDGTFVANAHIKF